MPLPGEPLSAPRLALLFVHPVKGCAALALERARVEPRGLEHDRRWMAVEPGGRFLSQRVEPRLALVRPSFVAGELGLEAEGHGRVPLAAGRERMACRVWGSDVDAARADAAAERWLSDFLGRPACLVHLDEKAQRSVQPLADGRWLETSFADELPLLVTAHASLEALNSRLQATVPMDRFRPNLVLEGSPPFAEDRWRRIAIGSVELELVKPAARCAVVTIDQSSGARDPHGEPLATLATFRAVPPRPQADARGVFFGVRAAPLADSGELRVGEEVRVLSLWS